MKYIDYLTIGHVQVHSFISLSWMVALRTPRDVLSKDAVYIIAGDILLGGEVVKIENINTEIPQHKIAAISLSPEDYNYELFTETIKVSRDFYHHIKNPYDELTSFYKMLYEI